MISNKLVMDDDRVVDAIMEDIANIDIENSYEKDGKTIFLSKYYDNKKYYFELNTKGVILEK